MQCAACGTGNRAGNQFCDQCGSPLASGCPSCGATNRPDARFCGTCGTSLADAPPSIVTRTDTERRLVSVLFADLVGFTTLAEDRDPERVRDLLSRFFDTATEVIEAHGGTVEKFIGDAVMAVWGTPTAREDDAERAVRAALELVDRVPALEPGLHARAGVNSGEAAVSLSAQNQGMVAGDLVNTAARLQGIADPDTVVAGEATMRAASRSIAFGRIGDQSLKGKSSPVPAWQALRVVAQRGGEGRTDALEPPFVGRDEELRQLKELLHATGRERRPRLVLVTGIGGIGKSRLVWELEKYVDGVTEQIRWHRGRSPSYGAGVTFWALGEMVRRRMQLAEDADEATTRERIAAALQELVPDASERERIGPALLSLLGVEDAPPGGRDALFPAWRSFFEHVARSGTTVLVFEDLQWADAGLLDFIGHLLEWSRNLPILVIALTRPELFEAHPGFGAGHRLLTSMALERLGDADVATILAALVPELSDDARDRIVRRAEGVPLYAVEMLRGLLADGRLERRDGVYAPVGDLSEISVPDSLRSLIAARLDSLEADDRALVQDAAVLGQVFPGELLASVTGGDHEAVSRRLHGLVRRELLDVERDPRSPERGQFRFVQSLIREVAYGTLSLRDRRSRHLAIARHFETIDDPELAGALAGHYLAAHDASEPGGEADALVDQARSALTAAAERALSLGSTDQALELIDRAIGISPDPAERARLQDRAVTAASVGGDQRAIEYAEAAIATHRAIGDEVAALRASARLGQQLITFGIPGRAREVLEATCEALRAHDAPEVMAEALAYLSRVYMRLGLNAEAIAAADEALVIAEARDLGSVITEAFVNKGSSLPEVGRPHEGIALLRAAVDRANAAADAYTELRARNNLGTLLFPIEPDAATRLTLESLDIASDVGLRGQYNWTLGTAAWALIEEGHDWDEHVARLAEAPVHSAIDRIRQRAMIGVFEAARGEALDSLEADVRELLRENDDPDNEFYAAYAAADTAISRGDYETGFRMAFAAIDISGIQPLYALMLATRAAIWGRDLTAARAVAERLVAMPNRGIGIDSYRRRVAAAIAALEGRPEEALGILRAAYAEVRRSSRQFEAAKVALEAAILLPGEPEVIGWAEHARATFESVRARPYLERLDAALAREAVAPAV